MENDPTCLPLFESRIERYQTKLSDLEIFLALNELQNKAKRSKSEVPLSQQTPVETIFTQYEDSILLTLGSKLCES